MAYNLTTNLPVPNPARIEVADVNEVRSVRNDPNSVVEMQVRLELRSGNASDREYGVYVLSIRNGRSDQLRVRSPYPAGMALQDMLEVDHASLTAGGVSTATGLDTCLSAWRTGGASGSGGRKDNLLNQMRTLQVIAQAGGLQGTVS